MPDMKEMGFILLVLLVSVSGIYEWTKTDALLSTQLGVDTVEGFESASLKADLNVLGESANELVTVNIISTNPITELLNFITALQIFFGTVWGIFLKLMFGWSGLVGAIFSSIGMSDLAIVFIVPVSVIQLIAALYFIRDIVNTLRGAG